MKLTKLLVVLVLSLSSLNLFAQTSDFIKRAIVTSAIDAREPVDNLDSVAGLDKVYFFTEVTNSANTMITHRWFLNGKLEAEVVLKIGSDRWRTYSSKNLVFPHHTGQWQVEAVDQNNKVIGYAIFTAEQ